MSNHWTKHINNYILDFNYLMICFLRLFKNEFIYYELNWNILLHNFIINLII
jgi:hypothetical protein